MGKIGSTILTFLFSIPVTAVGFMAIFGVPPIAALNASPQNDDIVIRDPYDQNPWGNAFQGQEGKAPNSIQDAPPYNGNQYGDQRHSSNESTAPTSRPNLYFNDSQQPGSDRFKNDLVGGSEQRQPPSPPRQFPNQPVRTNDNRLAMNFGSNAPPVSHENAPTNGMRNPFANDGSSSVRPNTTETSAQMLNWQEASARLTELGIKKYHLERGGQEGMFLFVCLYHPSDTPQVTHRFEAEGDNPLVAVNQVLAQVDGWLQQQYQESHKYGGVSLTR